MEKIHKSEWDQFADQCFLFLTSIWQNIHCHAVNKLWPFDYCLSENLQANPFSELERKLQLCLLTLLDQPTSLHCPMTAPVNITCHVWSTFEAYVVILMNYFYQTKFSTSETWISILIIAQVCIYCTRRTSSIQCWTITGWPKKNGTVDFFRTLLWSTVIVFHLAG